MKLTRREIEIKCKEAQQKTHSIVSFVVPEIHETGKLKDCRIALKDNISLKGVCMQAGSKILEGYVPVYDAAVVEQIKKEGGCIVAKTAMDELGMGSSGNNDCHGPVINPFDETRIAGGSSSGAACIVAVDGADISICTDTGDSIRRPACYTETIGIKPTYGTISRYGILPYASSMDTVGIITKSMDWAYKALPILQKTDPRDMMCVPVDTLRLVEPTLKGKRIGVFTTINALGDPLLQQAFSEFVQALQKQDVLISEVSMSLDWLQLVEPVYTVIANAEACSNHANLNGLRFGVQDKKQTSSAIRSACFSDTIKLRFMAGAYSLYQDNQNRLFVKAQKIRRCLCHEYQKLFEGVDAIISLTTPDIAPKIDETQPENDVAVSYLKLSNLSGYPALSMPLGKKGKNPFGLHIACKPYQESLMLELADGFTSVIRRLDHV